MFDSNNGANSNDEHVSNTLNINNNANTSNASANASTSNNFANASNASANTSTSNNFANTSNDNDNANTSNDNANANSNSSNTSNNRDPGKDKDKKPGLEAFIIVSQLGYTLSLPIVFGALAGNWIDEKLGTNVTFSLILILVGIATGITGAYKQIMYITRKKK